MTICDFKECTRWGGEVEFLWKRKRYGVFSRLRKTPSSPVQMPISQVCIENYQDTEKWCDTADEVLEYRVGEDRLRDVITQVTAVGRTS